jgi:hypothetical protein
VGADVLVGDGVLLEMQNVRFGVIQPYDGMSVRHDDAP